MYVVLEGVDCVGKSTQIKLLKDYFKDTLFTFEPGNTKLGKELRKLLLNSDFDICKEAECLLFLADRAQHFNELISKNKDKLIISDRSLISGMAYAKDFDKELLFRLNSFALSDFFPDKIIFLKADENTLKARLNSKNLDSIEKRGLEYFLQIQRKIEESILFLKEKKQNISYIILDAKDDKHIINKKIKDFIND